MRRILDTSVLIRHWRSHGGESPGGKTPEQAACWARELAQLHDTKAIVTPVGVEFLAGTRTGDELRLADAYLKEFEIIDGRTITVDDWRQAERLARRVPRDGNRRQLADCLIRAIADRLHYDVDSFDKRFPR